VTSTADAAPISIEGPSLAYAWRAVVTPTQEAATPIILTRRQYDVLKLMVRGLSNKEIARVLNLANGTVKIHVAALFGKLGVRRRAAVFACVSKLAAAR
jgi:DNA-binding NarL/FixJ family response regulator